MALDGIRFWLSTSAQNFHICDVNNNNGPFVFVTKKILAIILEQPKTRIEEPLKFRFGWGAKIDKT